MDDLKNPGTLEPCGFFTDEERFQWYSTRKKLLEAELAEAEMLFGLLKKRVERIQYYVTELDMRLHKKHHRNISRVTPEIDLQIVKLHEEGLAEAEIATRMTLHENTVARRLIQLGHKTPRKPLTASQQMEIIQLFSGGEGMSVRQIAIKLDLSATTVSKVVRRAGYESDPLKRKKTFHKDPDGFAARQDRILRLTK